MGTIMWFVVAFILAWSLWSFVSRNRKSKEDTGLLKKFSKFAMRGKAGRLEEKNNLLSAMEIYNELIESNPESVLDLNQAARLYLKMRQPAQAITLMEKAVKISPNNAIAWSNLGSAKKMSGDSTGAYQAFQSAFEKDHKAISALLGLAELSEQAKNFEMAAKWWTELVRQTPEDAIVWHNLGFAKLSIGDLAGAQEACEKGLKTSPNDSHILLLVGKIEAKRTFAEEAKSKDGVAVVGETVFGTSSARRTCSKCSGQFTGYGRVTIDNRSMGGALCKSCGNFYCEPCVAKVLYSGNGPREEALPIMAHFGKTISPSKSESGRLTCACGRSHASLNMDGNLALNNFEELVVFRAR